MNTEPGADRGPQAGSPLGVVGCDGMLPLKLKFKIRSLPLPVL